MSPRCERTNSHDDAGRRDETCASCPRRNSPRGSAAATFRRSRWSSAYLRRIEQRNPVINAYTLVLADEALDAARAAESAVMPGGPLGPLHGVPVAIKDLDDVAGVPTSMGSLAVRKPRSQDAAQRLSRVCSSAGAIVLGKTNTPEFGHKGITDNLRFGPTSTPWTIGYNSGGSSGGSAAAVADGMAALGQGTDGGGSVRIPASFSGVVGFKPSFGRIPSVTRPDAFLWGHPLVHIGPLARTVADAALMTSGHGRAACARSAFAARRRRRTIARARRRAIGGSEGRLQSAARQFPGRSARRRRR